LTHMPRQTYQGLDDRESSRRKMLGAILLNLQAIPSPFRLPRGQVHRKKRLFGRNVPCNDSGVLHPLSTVLATVLLREGMAMISRLLGCLFPATLVFLLSAPNCGSAQTEEPLKLEQKVADLALLWQEVNYNFAHFDKVPDLDWDSTFQAFIPQVAATESRIELIRVLQRFLALLREGHTNVVPPRELWSRFAAAPPLELDFIEERPVVVNATTSVEGDVPVGSVILSVEGVPVERYLAEGAFPFISAATDHDRLRKAI